MKKCKCKSAPDYHRDDCPISDTHGNLKNNNLSNYTTDDSNNIILEIEGYTEEEKNKHILELTNLVYEEIQERKKIFKQHNVKTYLELEEKTDIKLVRCYFTFDNIEDWRSTVFKTFALTPTEDKLLSIARGGRSYGIMIMVKKQ